MLIVLYQNLASLSIQYAAYEERSVAIMCTLINPAQCNHRPNKTEGLFMLVGRHYQKQ
jgi:hypothetical protein